MRLQAEVSATLDEGPTCSLPKIQYDALLRRDGDESARLLEICKSLGFFYLDLRSPASESLLDESARAFEFMKGYFDQAHDLKMQDHRGSVTHGYTPTGRYAGAVRGERDCYETLKISEAEMGLRSSSLPPAVMESAANADLFGKFIPHAHMAVLTILSALSDALGLTGADRFECKHRAGQPARTTMVLFKYPRQLTVGAGIGHNMHTDIGSLTLLFCTDWGLQVLQPDTNEWSFVEPKLGHAVINVGDSLRFMSGHLLKSCVHRVLPRTERQETDRYSIAYFLRPEDDTIFRDSKGRILPAITWHDEKYHVFREAHDKQETDAVLTGGMEKGGILVN